MARTTGKSRPILELLFQQGGKMTGKRASKVVRALDPATHVGEIDVHFEEGMRAALPRAAKIRAGSAAELPGLGIVPGVGAGEVPGSTIEDCLDLEKI